MILSFLDLLFYCYMIMLFIRVGSSWFPEYANHRFVLFVAYYTDPYLNLFRRLIPPFGVMDISPIVAFFALKLLEDLTKAFFR